MSDTRTDDRPKRVRGSNGGENAMASVKQTEAGNWYAVNEVNGEIIQGQPRGGFDTRRGAKRWAVNNIPAVRSVSEVSTF